MGIVKERLGGVFFFKVLEGGKIFFYFEGGGYRR